MTPKIILLIFENGIGVLRSNRVYKQSDKFKAHGNRNETDSSVIFNIYRYGVRYFGKAF